MNICITGHRPENLYGYNMNNLEYKRLKNLIYSIIEQLYLAYEELTLINGGALGTDQLFADESIKLKKKYPNVHLTLVKPCRNQSSVWNTYNKNKYDYICKNMDTIITIADNYTKTCMYERNIYMVDHSDIVIAVIKDNITKGGTKQCLNYALQHNKDIIIINPNTLSIKLVERRYKLCHQLKELKVQKQFLLFYKERRG